MRWKEELEGIFPEKSRSNLMKTATNYIISEGFYVDTRWDGGCDTVESRSSIGRIEREEEKTNREKGKE